MYKHSGTIGNLHCSEHNYLTSNMKVFALEDLQQMLMHRKSCLIPIVEDNLADIYGSAMQYKKSVTRVIVGHYEVCQMMPNNYTEGQNF